MYHTLETDLVDTVYPFVPARYVAAALLNAIRVLVELSPDEYIMSRSVTFVVTRDPGYKIMFTTGDSRKALDTRERCFGAYAQTKCGHMRSSVFWNCMSLLQATMGHYSVWLSRDRCSDVLDVNYIQFKLDIYVTPVHPARARLGLVQHTKVL
jgi:hypothetical protein